MHELSIAQSILETVEQEAAKHDGRRVVRIGLRIGEISGVDPDALSFSFEVITRGTRLEQAALDIERVPLAYRCAECGREFPVVNYEIACPACGGLETRPVGGDELAIAYLELE